MARFDVYANPLATERKHTPYLLDVQNDYIDALPTRIVVPLRREAVFGPRARNLNPALLVGADKVVSTPPRSVRCRWPYCARQWPTCAKLAP